MHNTLHTNSALLTLITCYNPDASISTWLAPTFLYGSLMNYLMPVCES